MSLSSKTYTKYWSTLKTLDSMKYSGFQHGCHVHQMSGGGTKNKFEGDFETAAGLSRKEGDQSCLQ